MNFKVLALGAALGFAIAVVPSCGTAKCSAANCKGCCGSDNKCQGSPNNTNNTTCGTSGGSCIDCTKTNQVCNATTFQCADGTGAGGGTGGGTGGGGGGGGTTCSGCTLPSGLCLTMPTTTNCGTGGAACAPCATGQLCNAGVCGTPDSGVVAGAIGSPCNTAADCVNVPLEQGFSAICKKNTIPGNTPYPNGYCTRRCLGADNCGGSVSGNVCAFVLGSLGEQENICLKACGSASGQCREADGYGCINFGSTQMPRPACWLLPGGNLPPEWDAGPGNPGNAGVACTSDSECGPAPSFGCIPESTDAGPTGYPGGQCTGDCTGSLEDSFCGDGGICLPTAYNAQGGAVVVWECSQGCNPTAANSCRPNYVCDPFSQGSMFGNCVPDCRVSTAFCGTQRTCNQTTGLCQ